MGSPRPAAQQILVRATVTCLFIHSLLFGFTSSSTGSSLCKYGTHSRGLHSSCLLPFSPRVFFFYCFSPSVSIPIPPLWLSPPSLYPSPSSFLLCASLPPSLPFIRLYAARHKFIGGTRDSKERVGDRGGLKLKGSG